jgi:anti-anti-sigma factor
MPRVVASARPPSDVSGPFVCGWSAVGECAVVRVAGQIDLATAPAFDAELRHVITTKLPRLVVDLRRVTALEPAGIDVLAQAHDLAVEHGGWLRTSGAATWLADLLQTIAPSHYPTLAEALPAYRPLV